MKLFPLFSTLGLIVLVAAPGCSTSSTDDSTSDPNTDPNTNANSDGAAPGDDAGGSVDPSDGGKKPGRPDGGDNRPGPCSGHTCADGDACSAADDCTSSVCENGKCSAPTATDHTQNGTETDVDCGGGAPTNAPRCEPGKACFDATDCDNVACSNGVCQTASGTDGIKNGTETDVDCGGGAPTNAARCANGKACTVKSDCDQADCVGKVCTPTKSDGIKNGTETDVDCGGGAPTNAPPCGLDKGCSVHDDCASSACAKGGPKDQKCIAAKSCTNYLGGYTCGKGSELGLNDTDQYESCCDTAPIDGKTTRIDRFAITAGRMRTFVERMNGNVQDWVKNHPPAGWGTTSVIKPDLTNATGTKTYKWLDLLPTTLTKADEILGPYWNDAPNDPNDTARSRETPYSKRSCGSGDYNGHTYWVGAATESAASQVYTKDQLDPKVLNCVPWHMVKALCAWDGGHLATADELNRAYTNNGTSTWPWSYAGSPYANPAYGTQVPYCDAWSDPKHPTEANCTHHSDDYPQDDRLNHNFRYGFPGANPSPDHVVTWWISPPGRFWKGWNKNKVEIDGNGLEWTGDAEYAMVWKQSFEHHQGNVGTAGDWRSQGTVPDDWARADVPNGYYAVNARCAYP